MGERGEGDGLGERGGKKMRREMGCEREREREGGVGIEGKRERGRERGRER